MKLFSAKTTAVVVVAPSESPMRAGDFPDHFEGRVAAVNAALSTLAGSADIGAPFGPGYGLEQACGWVKQLMPDPAEVHEAGLHSARTLIAGLDSFEIDFDAVDEVLGTTDAATRRFGLTRTQQSANVDAAQSAYDLLIALFQGTDSTNSRWTASSDLSISTLVYFQLAVLRLRATGKLWENRPTTEAGPFDSDVWATAL